MKELASSSEEQNPSQSRLINEIAIAWLRSFRESTWSIRAMAASVSLAFGFALMVGWRIENLDSVAQDSRLSDGAIYGFVLLEILVASVILLLALMPIFFYSARSPGFRRQQPSKGLWALPPVKRRLAIVGMIASPWFLYWLFLWPGIVTVDSYWQILQAIGFDAYSDHHPIAHTLMIQLILEPARAITGSIEISLSVVTLVQLVVLACITGLCLDALQQELRLPIWLRYAVLVFFAAHPVIGWYSVTLWKDVWLAAFLMMLGTVSTLILHRRYSGDRVTVFLWCMFFVAAMGVMFAKKTGIYVVVPTVLLSVLFMKGIRVRWLAVGMASVVCYLGLHAAIVTTLEVVPGRESVAYAIPMQQVARVVRDHGDGMTEQQVETLKRFFPEADLAQTYDPQFFRTTRPALDAEYFRENKGEFLSLWRELLTEFPGTYVEAFLAQNSGYWYPGTEYRIVRANDWVVNVNDPGSQAHRPAEVVDPNLDSTRTYFEPFPQAAAREVNQFLRHIPVFGSLFSLGAWTWAAITIAGVAVLRRQTLAVPVISLQALVWFSLLLSPVYAEARYAYPMLLMLPVMVVSTFVRVREEPELESHKCAAGGTQR